MSLPKFIISLAAAAALVPASHAAVVWNETTAGDLSNSGAAPTVITVAGGSNQIRGASGDLGAGTDLDYFTITVPVGYQFTALTLLPGTEPESLAFIGMQAGDKVTTFSAGGLLGWAHYGAEAGTDLFPRMSTAAGAIGFSAPLGAGSYAVWVQDYDSGASPYVFDLTIAAVPEPSTALAMAAGLIGLAGLRRRR